MPWEAISVIGGFIIAIVVQTAAMLKFLVARIDSADDRLHERINKVKDEYVRRDDFTQYMDRTNDHLTTIERKLTDHDRAMNSRIDNVLSTLATFNNNVVSVITGRGIKTP